MRRFRLNWRLLLAAVVIAMLTSSCVLTQVYGDSELMVSQGSLFAAQSGNGATFTDSHPDYGCGLMPDTELCARAGSTQTMVDEYQQKVITNSQIPRWSPSYVEVEFGIDDARTYSVADLTDYKTRIENFLGWLPAGVPVLWDDLPSMDPTYAATYQAINDALAAAASERPQLYIVGLKSVFAGHWLDAPNPSDVWFQTDGVHYNEDGQRAFALANCQKLIAVSAALGTPITPNCDQINNDQSPRSPARRISAPQ